MSDSYPITWLVRFLPILVVATICTRINSVAADELITGEFELVDHLGQVVNESHYDGKFRLVFFGFTHCPDICPTTMVYIKQAMKLLEQESRHVQPLFISIDPERDTPERLSEYVSAFGESFVGLTGTQSQLRLAAKSFNATYGLPDPGDLLETQEYYHSAYLYFMDRRGRFIDLFGYGTRPARIAAEIEQYLE